MMLHPANTKASAAAQAQRPVAPVRPMPEGTRTPACEHAQAQAMGKRGRNVIDTDPGGPWT